MTQIVFKTGECVASNCGWNDQQCAKSHARSFYFRRTSLPSVYR
jgi:hypothetical protein